MVSVSLSDLITLCKPRAVIMMLLTAWVSMLIALPFSQISWHAMIFGTIGILFSASAGGVVNHLANFRDECAMARTKNQPLCSGRVKPTQAIIFGCMLAAVSTITFFVFVNKVVAILSLATLVGYAGIYAVFLHRANPRSIVLGGLAAAMPPLLGWSVMTGHVDASSLLLVLIVYSWAPPHFLALSITRRVEYEKAGIPTLPVTHGVQYARLSILLYTILLVAVTYLPVAVDLSGLTYFIGASMLNIIFLTHAVRLYRKLDSRFALRTFHYSIFYLGALFITLLVDHFFPVLV